MPNIPPRPGEVVRDAGREWVRIPIRDAGGHEGVFEVARLLGGRFQVEGVFSTSELGILLRATDTRTGRAVLIKALRTDAIPIPAEALDRHAILAQEVRRLRHELQTERRLLVRLRNAGQTAVPHPIDYVFDMQPTLTRLGVETAGMEPYLVLPHLAGTDLESILSGDFPRGLPERLALEWMRPIVGVLAALHEPWRHPNGQTWHCVYQDLKPANILIDPSGRPRLLDFGGCQVVVDSTPVLEGGCTPGYAPPECIGPARVLLPVADVYGIGSTLHHMLTGIDPRDRLARWRGEPGGHLRAEDLPPGTPAPLRDLVAACLAPRPSGRVPSASQVAHRIDVMLAS